MLERAFSSTHWFHLHQNTGSRTGETGAGGTERVLPGEAASRPHGQRDLSEGTSCLDLPPQSLQHAQPACPEGPPLWGAHQGTSPPRQRCTPHSQVLTESGRHSVLSEQDRSTQGPPVSTFAPGMLFPRGRQRGI